MSGPGVETLVAAEELKEEDLSHLSMPAFFCLMDKRLVLMNERTKADFKSGFSQMVQQFTQMEKQWKTLEQRHEKTEAKVTELDERITAIEKKIGEEASTPRLAERPLTRPSPSPAPSEEACFRQLVMGPAEVDDNGVAAVDQLVHEVLYDIMGFPNKDPFRVGIEGVSVTKKTNNQVATDMYAKVTFVDANIRKQVLLSQSRLAHAKRKLDIRIVVPHSMKRMERAVDKILYFLRALTRGTAGKRCQTNIDVNQGGDVVGMYRWKTEGQSPGRWSYIEPFEDMLNPELHQFDQFVGKTADHMNEEWKKIIVSGFDPITGKIQ